MKLTSAECLEKLRTGRTPEREPAYRRMEREVTDFLAGHWFPPDEAAGFYHHYFCPKHGVQLSFNPEQPHVHLCPVEGKPHKGGRLDASWRWFVNNRLSEMTWKLGLLWTVGGDPALLKRAEDILTGYADRYGSYRPQIDATPRPGRATYQSLDEAAWLIPIVRGFDLIEDSLPRNARDHISDDLLKPAALHVLGQKSDRIHNVECWHNAAIGAVGLCLEDGGLVHSALDAPFGFHHQLREGTRTDGLWWEGSSSYHFYTLAALMYHSQTALGRRLWESERLRLMFRAPIDLACPDGRLPATNDCWLSSSLFGEVCHGVPPAAAFYETAFAWYGDPAFAWVLSENYKRNPRESLESLLFGVELPSEAPPPPSRHAVFPASGFGLFRSPDRDHLLMKCGPSGGTHGHPDKLSLSWYARGHPVSTDMGTSGYGLDLHRTWYRQTLSHNTVTVNGLSQPPANGRMLAFRDAGDHAVMDADVCWQEGPYSGVSMRRVVLWTEGYFIDGFTVEGGGAQQTDWTLRIRGELCLVSGLQARHPAALIGGNGYEHIRGAAACRAKSAATLRWRLPDSPSPTHVDLFLPREADTTVIRGRVPGNPSYEESDILLRRRQAVSTTYWSVVHSWSGEPFVNDVTDESRGALAHVPAFRVDTAKGPDLWIIGGGPWDDPPPVTMEGYRRVVVCRLVEAASQPGDQ